VRKRSRTSSQKILGMDRRSVQKGISRSWEAVNGLGIGETFANGAPLDVVEEFRNIILSDDTDYITVFLAGLRLSHYNFLLIDYSYFQFSHANIGRIRYAFYPNPFAQNLADFKRWQELVGAGYLTQEEYLGMLRDTRADFRIPVIRYENAPGQHKGLRHPCSHFHIGHHSDNRWAINRVLTPLAFVLLVVKLYYGTVWREIGDDETDAFGNILESCLVRERTNCRLIDEVLFTKAEERSFFFS
jgi:hypothetical protein